MKKFVAAAAAICMGAVLLLPVAACGDLPYSTPTGGSGFGEYADDLTVMDGGKTNNIVGATFDPYMVKAGKYAVTVKDEESKVYFAFSAGRTGVFSVASEGDADPCVIQLFGNPIGGIRNPGEEYGSDNISETDKNFKYEFKCDERDMEGAGGVLYFEIGISDSASAGKTFAIVFKYEREYVSNDPTYENVAVAPQEEFKTFAPPEGKKLVQFRDRAFKPNDVTPVLGKDGYYHINSEDGELLYALLARGSDEDNPNLPFTLDIAFDEVGAVANGMNFCFTVGNYRYIYIDFMDQYCAHANQDGVYPVTEEMKQFLTYYCMEHIDVEQMHQDLMKTIPENWPWIAACGYYA